MSNGVTFRVDKDNVILDIDSFNMLMESHLKQIRAERKNKSKSGDNSPPDWAYPYG